MMDKITICDALKYIRERTKDDNILEMLNYIDERCGAMEDRLLEYCNAIEGLGFERIGRDYKNQ